LFSWSEGICQGGDVVGEQPDETGWNQQSAWFSFKLPPGWRDMSIRELTAEFGKMIAGAVSTTSEVREIEALGQPLTVFGRRLLVHDPLYGPPIAFPADSAAAADDGLDGWMDRYVADQANFFQTINGPYEVMVGRADGRLIEKRSDQGGGGASVLVAVSESIYTIDFQCSAPLDGATLQAILDSWQWNG
jgi:hypothetical protein